MKTVSKRELNQQTARVLAAVDAGDAVVVTERGVARWRIEAIAVHPDPIERLRAEGRIKSATKSAAPWLERDHRTRTPDDVDALLAEMREDR